MSKPATLFFAMGMVGNFAEQ